MIPNLLLLMITLMTVSCMTVLDDFPEMSSSFDVNRVLSYSLEVRSWKENGNYSEIPTDFLGEIKNDLKEEAKSQGIELLNEKGDAPHLDLKLNIIEGTCSIVTAPTFCTIQAFVGLVTFGLLPTSAKTVYELEGHTIKNGSVDKKFVNQGAITVWYQSFLAPVTIYELFARKDRKLKKQVFREFFSTLPKNLWAPQKESS